MAIATSPRCCRQTAGRWTRIGFSAIRASRGAEGPEPTETLQSPLAERRLLRAATAAQPQRRLELRLRAGSGARWAKPAHPDEHSRACLALKVARRIDSLGVIEALADAMCLHGIPEHICCDNGPEMISKALRNWVAKTG